MARPDSGWGIKKNTGTVLYINRYSTALWQVSGRSMIGRVVKKSICRKAAKSADFAKNVLESFNEQQASNYKVGRQSS